MDGYNISVAIPTFEYYGMGINMLNDLFLSLYLQQDIDSFQVVVSDHSVNNEIENFCNLNFYNLNIKYIRNSLKRGNPGNNHNNVIDHSDGKIIKLMQQDDFFYDHLALNKIYNALSNSDHSWLVNGCIHTEDDGRTFVRPHFPFWNFSMLKQNVNNIGGVSTLAIKKNVISRFDEKTRMLLDVDMYFNLQSKYGDAIYYKDLLTVSRCREENRLSAEVSPEEIEEELEYCRKKYNIIKEDINE